MNETAIIALICLGAGWFFGVILGLLYHQLTSQELKARERYWTKNCKCDRSNWKV